MRFDKYVRKKTKNKKKVVTETDYDFKAYSDNTYELLFYSELEDSVFEDLFEWGLKRYNAKTRKNNDFDINLIEEFEVPIDKIPKISKTILKYKRKILQEVQEKIKHNKGINIPYMLAEIEQIKFKKVANKWYVILKFTGDYTYEH